MNYIIYLLIFFPVLISAQSNLTTAGGDLKGEGGSVSQSIGQLSYAEMSSDGISVSEGVIQVYEITVLSGNDNYQIQLFYKAFPNPVNENLYLSVENFMGQILEYQIFDNESRLIVKGNIESALTAIETSNLIPANYFLLVTKYGKTEKSFKIVKI